MQGFTYTQLNQALQDWAENTSSGAGEFVENIDRLIQLGELRVVKDLNLEIFDVSDTTAVVTLGSRDVLKPTGLIVCRDLMLITAGVRTPLYKRSPAFCNTFAPNPSTTGTPRYYCEEDDGSWKLFPTPAANATVYSRGIYRPESLVDEEQTWLGDTCGDLIFAATLMEAEHYLKADDRYADYKSKYYEELLPVARMELRELIRGGDYAPYRPTAERVK